MCPVWGYTLKTKVVVRGSITMDDLSKINVVICKVCSLRVKANSVLFA